MKILFFIPLFYCRESETKTIIQDYREGNNNALLYYIFGVSREKR